ncbi:MAG: AbrB/MazE/SpoVT family DNA-binding domain-containing protein [Thaumarchaeota archaeon]|nr:AbrB/MazE/SpoVT family DNA-binding domain-containing protein [Nitrososphaerota archaeon]
MIIRVKLGDKGQVVIPKVVRESVGLSRNGLAIVEVKEKEIAIRPLKVENIVEDMRERAKRYGIDVSKLVYGDKLYEEEFK